MEEFKVGDIIKERYSLIRFLGSGSFGEVWMARDILTNRDVAVKIYLSLDPTGIDEFKREYSNTLDISSPYLLTPEYFDTYNRRPFLVMKYCEKGASSKLCGNISEKQLWKFVEDVARGLDILHNFSDPIIHQDIKPDNILIDTQNRYLITDFGISKRLRATMRRFSKRDISSGAMPYMAPERFESSPKLNTASDIWSLGASIYELATGELPFNGFGGAMQRNGAEKPDITDRFSSQLNALMQRCLCVNPQQRPTANEIVKWSSLKNIPPICDLNLNPLNSRILETNKTVEPKPHNTGFNRTIFGYISLGFVIAILLGVIFWNSFRNNNSNPLTLNTVTSDSISDVRDNNVIQENIDSTIITQADEPITESSKVPKPSKTFHNTSLPFIPSGCPYIFIKGIDHDAMRNNKSISLNVYGRDYTFSLGDNHPNGIRALVMTDSYGDNLFNHLSFTQDDQETYFDEFDFLNEDCNIQLTIMDLDNDDECEVLLTLQSESFVTEKTYVFKLLPSPYRDSIVKYLGVADGQVQMFVQNKSIIAPYGSQGLYEEYIITPNNKLISID